MSVSASSKDGIVARSRFVEARSTIEDPLYAEHARAIGIVVAQYTLLETHLVKLFAVIEGMDEKRAKIAFHAILSNPTRMNIIEATLMELWTDSAVKARWSSIKRRIKNASDRRNEIVHSVWQQATENSVERVQTVSRGVFTTEKKTYTAKQLQHVITQIARIAMDVLYYVEDLKKTAPTSARQLPSP